MDAPAVEAPVSPQILRSRAGREPDAVPLNVDDRATITFAEWDRRSDAVACAMAARSVRFGERIGLLFADMDWVDYAVAYVGVLKAGATAVHLSDELDPAELRRRLDECEVSALVHGASVAVPRVAGWTPAWAASVAALDGGTGRPPDVALGPEDIADVLYTSGTTGAAKAFVNPHGTLTFGKGPAGLAAFDNSAPVLAPMPMGTPSSAGTVGMLALTSTTTVVLCPLGDVERMADLIARHRVATVLLTPWTAQRLVAARVHERHDVRSVTRIAIASAHLPPSVAARLLEMMPGATIHTAYAQGEAVPAVVLGQYDPDRPLVAGHPAAGTELRVVDAGGSPAPPGTIGEIWLRSEAPRRRYLDERLNREVHVDGWVRTRDLGWIGEDGELHVFDREVDAIRSGGRLLSSIEIEDVLYAHPAVGQAAVVGLPDPELAQVVAAVVVVEAGRQGSADEEVRSIRAHARDRLPPEAVPRVVRLAGALPRGVTGKVLKRELRRELGTG